MKEHPQAEILRAIADGKTVQMRNAVNLEDNEWWEPSDALGYINSGKHEFRVKPETITINGHEVPCPVREPLEVGTKYWLAGPNRPEIAEYFTWRNQQMDEIWLKRGLIHLTEEAAIAHAEALLSFTRSDK